MAAVDKLYGNEDQFLELRAWISKYKPEAEQYLHYVDETEKEDPYFTGGPKVLCNFPEHVDEWLLENCTIEWVVLQIKEQYAE